MYIKSTMQNPFGSLGHSKRLLKIPLGFNAQTPTEFRGVSLQALT